MATSCRNKNGSAPRQAQTTPISPMFTFLTVHVWTAPAWQGLSDDLWHFGRGAVVCPAFERGTHGRWPWWSPQARSHTILRTQECGTL